MKGYWRRYSLTSRYRSSVDLIGKLNGDHEPKVGVMRWQHQLRPKVCSNPRVELKPAFLLDWDILFFAPSQYITRSWPRNAFQWPSEETRNMLKMLKIAVFYMLHDQAKSPLEVIKPYHICNWITNWRERSYTDPVDWFDHLLTCFLSCFIPCPHDVLLKW